MGSSRRQVELNLSAENLLEPEWPTTPWRYYIINFQSYFAYSGQSGYGFRIRRTLMRKTGTGYELVRVLHGHGVSPGVMAFGDLIRKKEEDEGSYDSYAWQNDAYDRGVARPPMDFDDTNRHHVDLPTYETQPWTPPMSKSKAIKERRHRTQQQQQSTYGRWQPAEIEAGQSSSHPHQGTKRSLEPDLETLLWQTSSQAYAHRKQPRIT